MKVAAALLSVALLVGCATRGVPRKYGIPNFGKVNESLYRGGQPDADAIQQLSAMGIKSVVNLCMADAWEGEQDAARAASISYANIPLRSFAAPTDEQVANILAAISTMPQPVFVHCRRGCDRTGTIIACYRIQQEHWDNVSALKEAKSYGISCFEIGMRKYITHFKGRVCRLPAAAGPGVSRAVVPAG